MGMEPANVVACSEYLEGIGVEVTFSSVHAAAQFCSLTGLFYVEYEDSRLVFVQQSQGHATFDVDSNRDASSIIESTFVEVTNLPPDFVQAHFLKFLNKTLKFLNKTLISYNIVEPNDRSAVKDVMNKEGDSVIVEFVSVKVAMEVCKCCSAYEWYYEDYLMCMKSVEGISSAAADVASGGCGSSHSLTDYEMTLHFVKVLLKLRHLFTGRNHDSAYARMHVDLLQLGIAWDVPTITRKRRNLLDTYKKKERTGKLAEWELSKPVAVILGLADINTLDNSDFAENDCDTKANDLEFLMKGAVWTHTATKALIAICVENREKYASDTVRHSTFFREVSAVLAEKGHHYSSDQCDRKMCALKKCFKDETQRLKKTGAATLSGFPYMDDMQELMQGDASVTPPISMAVGVSALTVQHNAAVLNRGVTRASTVKRPRGLGERRVKAIEDIAEALQRKYSP